MTLRRLLRSGFQSLARNSALVAVGLLTPAGTLAAAEFNWDMANEYNATSIHAEGDKLFAKVLAEKSGGKIAITHHFGGSIGYKSKDQLDAVGDGALPIADTYVGPLGGIDPMFLLPSLPFLASTTEEAKTLWEVAKPYYEKIFANNNQMLLYASPWPPSGIWAKNPVASLEELKNLKIRTYDANGTITLKAAGAAPIQLSWADVVPQLSTGGIQAVLTSAEGGTNAKFWEHLNHFTEINYAMPLNMVHINMDTYEELPDELQQAVLDAAQAASDHNWNAVVKRVESNYADMKANDTTVVSGVDKKYLQALSEAGNDAVTQWLEKTGGSGKRILTEYRQRTGKK